MPYLTVIISYLLKRMSDQDDDVRQVVTFSFGQLVRLMPLESSAVNPPGMSEALQRQREVERRFLERLLDSSKIVDFKIPVPINATLRRYQQEGVNWLAFLLEYNLHGVLCDDMGLGKTLQTLCIMASSHHLMSQKAQEKGEPKRPSLVICPPTVAGHWKQETLTYTKNMRPMIYTGPRDRRAALLPQIKNHDVIITSYDVVRTDIGDLSKIKWNYCVLDEGHVIKNPKSKLSQAVRQLVAEHRLMLSGTPIQNSVLELWSIFDFLMPGFLGSQKSFNERFGKPIMASGDPKSSPKVQEAGALALETLHKQVLPFLLRRMKEDVLQDLPPKIIQDYYCELSDVQRLLYDSYSTSKDNSKLRTEITAGGSSEGEATTHVFQVLQYLRQVCNHPALVLTKEHQLYGEVTKRLKDEGTTIRDLRHAPKLLALRQVLLDCGIGAQEEGESQAPGGPLGLEAVKQHRALIFCQQKSMVKVVEEDVLQQMQNVTYLKLDGSVNIDSRQDLVQKFNSDPSIDVLLLTTAVGGVGLNLTGADTVIFVEHDWNPSKDLQAMDRAHRLGQKKVVNVYRLITKGTLEEKIMGLQQFKLKISNTVISQENSSLASMGTEQLLDLFHLTTEETTAQVQAMEDQVESTVQKFAGVPGIPKGLAGELEASSQYEDFDMGSFIQSLSDKK